MPVFQRPVYVQQFSELGAGDLFILSRNLGNISPTPSTYRKISDSAESNARIENWEGEGCNGGIVTLNLDDDVTALQ